LKRALSAGAGMNSQLDQLSTDGSRFRVMLGEPNPYLKLMSLLVS
jgi:hypothetical protein